MADAGEGSPDPDHVPLDAEAKALKLDQTKAESRKAIAEAEQAVADAHKKTLLARLPSSDVEPLEGKIDVGEKSGLAADLLAHSLVREAAARIAEAIDGPVGANARILVAEDRHLATIDWPYQAVRRQLTQQKRSIQTAVRLLEREVREPRPGVPTLAPAEAASAALETLATAAPAAVGALAAVAGMFHSDYAITSRDVTITATPLVSAVTAALLTPQREVTIAGFHLIRESAISTDFWDAWNARVKLEQLRLQVATGDVAPIEQETADLQRQLDAAVTELEQDVAAADTADHAALTALRGEIDRLERALAGGRTEIAPKKAAVAVAEAAIQRFDAFANATTAAAADGTYPPLVAAAIQERLRLDEPQTNSSHRDKRFTHVLFVAVEASGGETVTRRNIFLGSRLRYVAGTHFSYVLLDTRKNLTVAAGSDSLLASLKYRLFWYPTGPRDPTVKLLHPTGG